MTGSRRGKIHRCAITVSARLGFALLYALMLLGMGHASAAHSAYERVAPKAFTTQNRSLVSSAITRNYLLAIPGVATAGLPLVISMHGDGGNGAGARATFALEAASADGAVFVYPDAPGGTFEYFSDLGRAREVQFVRDLVNALEAELGIDRTRVFLVGFSGGATMANALGCRMEADEIRGLGIHSGSLYPVGNDFTYTGNGGVSCALPAAMLIWGMNDATPGVDYATGQAVRNNHVTTQTCAATTTPRAPSPCVDYDGCGRDVAWCAIAGLGHSPWGSAGAAFWQFFADQLPPTPPAGTLTIYDDALRNSFEDYSWGEANFASVAAPRSGTNAIRFTAYDFEGLSFARPATPVSTAAYPELHFWIRGTAGGENLSISLQSGMTLHADQPLAGFIDGGAVVAGQYREVRVVFAQPPISYNGTFERINLQDQSGNAVGMAQMVDVDDVVLVPAGAPVGDDVFGDGFESP
jgi:polyhydroxybutyrate depolymerase